MCIPDWMVSLLEFLIPEASNTDPETGDPVTRVTNMMKWVVEGRLCCTQNIMATAMVVWMEDADSSANTHSGQSKSCIF